MSHGDRDVLPALAGTARRAARCSPLSASFASCFGSGGRVLGISRAEGTGIFREASAGAVDGHDAGEGTPEVVLHARRCAVLTTSPLSAARQALPPPPPHPFDTPRLPRTMTRPLLWVFALALVVGSVGAQSNLTVDEPVRPRLSPKLPMRPSNDLLTRPTGAELLSSASAASRSTWSSATMPSSRGLAAKRVRSLAPLASSEAHGLTGRAPPRQPTTSRSSATARCVRREAAAETSD